MIGGLRHKIEQQLCHLFRTLPENPESVIATNRIDDLRIIRWILCSQKLCGTGTFHIFGTSLEGCGG